MQTHLFSEIRRFEYEMGDLRDSCREYLGGGVTQYRQAAIRSCQGAGFGWLASAY